MKIKQSMEIPIEFIFPNPSNPNVMTEKQLNKLCEQILEYGFTEPLMVGLIGPNKYEIISGHHRHSAAKHLGMERVPCVVYEDWSEAKREVAMIRMNVVKGKMNPQKFMKVFSKHANEFGEEIAKEMMGFADEGAYEEIKKQIMGSLPKPVREKVEEKEKNKEISSVEELAKVVSELMAEFGGTVPLNYIHFTHGGADHIMQRTDDELWKTLKMFYRGLEAENLDAIPVLKILFENWQDVVLRKQKPRRKEA